MHITTGGQHKQGGLTLAEAAEARREDMSAGGRREPGCLAPTERKKMCKRLPTSVLGGEDEKMADDAAAAAAGAGASADKPKLGLARFKKAANSEYDARSHTWQLLR